MESVTLSKIQDNPDRYEKQVRKASISFQRKLSQMDQSSRLNINNRNSFASFSTMNGREDIIKDDGYFQSIIEDRDEEDPQFNDAEDAQDGFQTKVIGSSEDDDSFDDFEDAMETMMMDMQQQV